MARERDPPVGRNKCVTVRKQDLFSQLITCVIIM